MTLGLRRISIGKRNTKRNQNNCTRVPGPERAARSKGKCVDQLSLRRDENHTQKNPNETARERERVRLIYPFHQQSNTPNTTQTKPSWLVRYCAAALVATTWT